jgi:sec-independent protein translocase protein TatA
MGMPSMPELLVILAIVVLLFGAKKIPDLAKGIGKGIKDFKKAVREDDEESSTKELKDNSKREDVVANSTKADDTKRV